VKKPTQVSAAAAVRQYRVAGGDTVWTIARRFGTSVNAITAANGMASPHRLRIGQVLVLPGGGEATAAAPARPAASASPAGPPQGASVTYRVREGDTLSAIARRYATTVGAIAAANDLASAHRLKVGQRLTVPLASGGGTAPAHELTTTPSTLSTTATAGGFVWPARGLLTSRYGWRYRRHHDGVDLAAPHGSPIYAARAGRVVFAGWYYGYGRAVIIEHGGGLTTLYGHASSLLVRTGETVRRGQVIARIGCTGRCSGPHLHFEVRIGGRAVNPLRYLD
jgi:murein DD-endopeptidase MepM/ murein hydrolase activator NlpD